MFGRSSSRILLDADKVETRHPIDELDEIYAHADGIRGAVSRYAE